MSSTAKGIVNNTPGRWLHVESILVEAWEEGDSEGAKNSISLPKGAYIEIVKSFTQPSPETHAPITLYWLKFHGDPKTWLCTPQWWDASVVDELPPRRVPNPDGPKEHQASNIYKLVRVDDDN